MKEKRRARGGLRSCWAAIVFPATIAGGVAPAAAQTLPRLDPVSRIGCSVCDGPQLFADITSLTIDPDGNIWVIDSTEPYIRVFTAEGAPVKAFGRRGDGPGEFRTPVFLAVRSDGSFTVLDTRTSRLSRHGADGTETAALPFRRFPVATATNDDGDVWLATTDFRSLTLTVQSWPADRAAATAVLELERDFPRRDEATPSSFVSLAATPDGGFAIADGTTFYHVRVYDGSGRRVADITRDIERPERSPAEISAEEARRDRSAARIAAMRSAEGGAPGRLPGVSRAKPHFLTDALVYDEVGRLWVRTERGSLNESVFDVFGQDRAWLGEIRVPGRMRRFTITAGLLAGIVFDADEAQYVQIYRIVR